MRVVADIDVGKILSRRGLQPSGLVQQRFTQECAKRMDSYVPMQHGILKNTRFVGADYVEYNQPHAHYQYTGILYLAPSGSPWARSGERKHPSDKELTYHGAPMRGKLWDVRMWADHKRELLDVVAKACGGRTK